MAKTIRSLTPAARLEKRTAANNQVKEPPKNSITGVRRKEELNRRAIRDINNASQKHSALRELKRLVGSEQRERKPFIPAGLFAADAEKGRKRGLTPRQIARIFRRPAALAVTLTESMSDEQVSRISEYFENLLEEKEPALQAA